MAEVTHSGVSNRATNEDTNGTTHDTSNGITGGITSDTSNGTVNGTSNGTSSETPIRRRIWICSHGRTASNLLMTLFAKHPELAITDYNFHDAFMFGPERLMNEVENVPMVIPPERLEACENATFQRGLDTVQEFIASAEAGGKIPFVKEHAQFIFDPETTVKNLANSVKRRVISKPIVVDRSSSDHTDPATSSRTSTNPTVLPDSFLKTMSPVIMIRHPARMIPSFYRAITDSNIGIHVNDGDFPVQATFRWSRLVFDWYAQHVCPTSTLPGPYKKSERAGRASWPIVIDGDDLINDENVAPELCKQLGIDPNGLQMQWEGVTDEQKLKQGTLVTRFLDTIQNSTRIIKSGKTDDLDLEKEKVKLLGQFGEELGGILIGFIERAMPDYMHLREYRL